MASDCTHDELVDQWTSQFNDALESDDLPYAVSLFTPEGYLRDLVALTWDLKTYRGHSEIESALRLAQAATGPRNFRLAGPNITKRKKKPDGSVVVETILDFDTHTGTGQAVLRLVPAPDGGYRAWVLATCLTALRDYPELVGEHRPSGEPSLASFAEKNWIEQREHQLTYSDRHPDVLIVGAGHSGLGVAARLGALGVDALVVDRLNRVGDIWRNRYHSLVLHNAVWLNHLPYIPFPDTWPLYVPKDKLANWLEFYADSCELNVWSGTELEAGSYDDDQAHWTARLRGVKGERILNPKHIIMATGASGVPRWPAIEGLSDFAGKVIHSDQFRGATTLSASNVVVFGSGNSAHDVAQDIYTNSDCHVTMVQRSSTTVVDLRTAREIYDRYSHRLSAEHADLMLVATPYDLSVEAFQGLTQNAIVRDRELISKLNAVGFKTDYGEDATGHRMKYLRRGGGYYINVGCSNLIADGAIDVLQYERVDRVVPDGVRVTDGSVVKADLIVMATGYENQRAMVKQVFGDEVASRVGPVWGYDEGGELRAMYKRTGQPGLWFHAGSMMQSRIFSRSIALQIKADLEGLRDREVQDLEAVMETPAAT